MSKNKWYRLLKFITQYRQNIAGLNIFKYKLNKISVISVINITNIEIL
jgi:hypothetical protein